MIVSMKHLDLVCLAADREATVAKLRDLGVVHLDLASAGGRPSCPQRARSRPQKLPSA